MLNVVEVRTAQGRLLRLPLQDYSSGYLVADIDGLDPVKASIVSSPFASLPGEQYQASRLEKRNITIELELYSDPDVGSVETLRKNLYLYFMPKSRIALRFYTSEGLIVEISGRVESFESTLFTKTPTVKLSVLCFDPDFYALDQIVVTGTTTSGTTDKIIEYQGSTETGIRFELNVNRPMGAFTIQNRTEDDMVQTLEFASPLSSGNVLEISTVSGAKGASIRGGSSILYGVSPDSNWINLFPGKNLFRVFAEGAAVPYTIRYTNKFGGL